MKTKSRHGFVASTIAWLAVLPLDAQTLFASSPAPPPSIPLEQLGTVAGKQYHGEGLALTATAQGARLRCDFQRLEGVVTSEGLWLSSTAGGSSGERFRVLAVKVGRSDSRPEVWAATDPFYEAHPALAVTGTVNTVGEAVRVVRDGLIEEYSVSVDGVRQDFVIEQRPDGAGELRLELNVIGAKAYPLVNGAQLVLVNSGRKLVYHRLRVVDARSKELTARLEITDENRLNVVVNDANAVYPICVDPTFSDANWSSMNPSICGANGEVFASVVDGSGNLYIAGSFTAVGDVIATNIAKWDGSSWSAVGSGIEGYYVYALAVLGSDLYAGGWFATAGGRPASNIAKWNGNSWAPLASGLNSVVSALAVSGAELYAGGQFWMAGDTSASGIAKWDGNSWSALGSGMDGSVKALAVSGNNLYVGGGVHDCGW